MWTYSIRFIKDLILCLIFRFSQFLHIPVIGMSVDIILYPMISVWVFRFQNFIYIFDKLPSLKIVWMAHSSSHMV